MKIVTKYIFSQVAANQLSQEKAKEMLLELQGETDNAAKEIAIIGIAGKFPKAENLDEYWSNLVNGISCIDTFPENRRRECEEFCAQSQYAQLLTEVTPTTNPGLDNPYMKGGYLKEIDKFDAAFFRIPPREAKFMDPFQRLFVETAYEALEDSGYTTGKLSGAKVGVYVGKDHTNPSMYKYVTEPDPLHLTGSWAGILASRIAYIFNFRGPCLVIDTACSSGLVAIHEACLALQNQDCELAIAGGIQVQLFPVKKKPHGAMAMVESSDEQVRTFDKDANGTVWGEGVGAVLMKPLSKAIAARDHIYAVIKGSSVNNDGASIGISAPNAEAQKDVIVKAWQAARINPETISYLEAHGTGTNLGDPIELKGITSAFGEFTAKKQFCGIGSVKTNVGHLVAAAGLASVIKVSLAFKNQLIPPNINFQTPNPIIDFINSPVYVNDRARKWEPGPDSPRRAGISAFGFSGTNCHLVLEEAPATQKEHMASQDYPLILTLSACGKNALQELINRYRNFLGRVTEADLVDICYTANTGRGDHHLRIAFQIAGLEDLKEKMAQIQIVESHGIHRPGIYFVSHPIDPENKNTHESSRLDYVIAENERRQLNFVAAKKIQEFLTASKELRNPLELGETLCRLYIQGADIDWETFYQDQYVRRLSLPVYPMERIRCWAEPNSMVVEDLKSNQNISFQKAVSGEKDPVTLQGRRNGIYSQTELHIAQVWGDILGFEILNLHHNFFELGGDSMMTLNIVNGINQRLDINLNAADFIQNPTIQKLAAFIEHKIRDKALGRIPEQGIVEGEIQLLPVQRRFFSRNFTDAHHWNVSTMIHSKVKIDEAALSQAITKVVEHHDALRVVFHFEGEVVRQYNRGLEKEKLSDLVVVDLTNHETWLTSIKTEISKIQGSIDLTRGPVLKFGLFKTKEGDHLLLVAHHLIVDGISMQIILDDIGASYLQILDGKQVFLPPKTDSLRDWSRAIQRFADSHLLQSEIAYWNRIEETPITPLPKDGRTDQNQLKDSRTIKKALLSAVETRNLINSLKQESAIDMKTLLLAALGFTLRDWTGENRFLIHMVAHGRDSVVEDLDISRTVGWLSIYYPVILQIDQGNKLMQQALQVKQTINEIPTNGIGYEILRYITLPKNGPSLQFKLAPEISFNFIGQIDLNENGNNEASLFSFSPISSGVTMSYHSEREYTFVFDLYFIGGTLNLKLNFNRFEYHESTILKLIDEYSGNLRRIINHY